VPASIAGLMKDEIFQAACNTLKTVTVRRRKVEPAVVGGDLLIGSGAGLEKVTQLVVHHVDQRAGLIDGAVEITPLPVDLDVGLVNIPAAAPLPRRRRRRLSAKAGVSLASQ